MTNHTHDSVDGLHPSPCDRQLHVTAFREEPDDREVTP